MFKLQTTYGWDNTKQAEMSYFHCGPSRQEKFTQIRSAAVLKIIKITNDKIITATIKIIVIILVTMQKHNHTNDINNDAFS